MLLILHRPMIAVRKSNLENEVGMSTADNNFDFTRDKREKERQGWGRVDIHHLMAQ